MIAAQDRVGVEDADGPGRGRGDAEQHRADVGGEARGRRLELRVEGAELEQAIDDAEAELEPLRAFILPGGTPKAAALHVARTVCRRAERHVVRLQHDVELPGLVVIYMNRLSDLLFTLARLANKRAGAGEVTW